jgi:hypothetical protein
VFRQERRTTNAGGRVRGEKVLSGQRFVARGAVRPRRRLSMHLPWGGFSFPIVYRFRPYGDDGQKCFFETMLMAPFEGERPSDAALNVLPEGTPRPAGRDTAGPPSATARRSAQRAT